MNNKFGFYPEIPENIRDIFMQLCQDFVALNNKWDFYLELYSSAETTSLLSKMALASFHLIEEALRADMVLSICRLNDPPQSCGQNNLSFPFLHQHIHNSEVDNLFTQFETACSPFKTHRNKQVGHNDLNTSIKPHSNPLPNIEKEQIDLVINIASDILNAILKCYVYEGIGFNFPQIGGGKNLVHWLKIAREYKQKQKHHI